MNGIGLVAAFVTGLLVGVGIALSLYVILNRQRNAEVKNDLMRMTQDLQKKSIDELVTRVNESFKGQTSLQKAELSNDFMRIAQELQKKSIDELVARANESFKGQSALQKAELNSDFMKMTQELQKRSIDELVKRANEAFKGQSIQHNQELMSKKALIDQQLNQMNEKLGSVASMIQEFETSRTEKIGALGQELNVLLQTTGKLQQALVNNRERGQWGERMAEDLLKRVGLVEGISYVKQTSVGMESSRKIRPDFTFILPNEMRLNMDAKFPYDNYVRFIDAKTDADKATYKSKFLSDVTKHMKEIVTKEYINTEQNTLDCVLLFIPNEAIYNFLHECSPIKSIFDEAMRHKVVICSPINLFAVLAVIRHASDNYRIETASQEILTILKDFRKQWNDYVGKLDDISKQFDKTQSIFNDLMGKRKTNLDKQLAKIDNIEIKATSESTEVPALPELAEA